MDDVVRPWDKKVDGVPPVDALFEDFNVIGHVRVTDADGDWFGVTDGKNVRKLALVAKSAARLAFEEKTYAEAAASIPSHEEIADQKAQREAFFASVDRHVVTDDAAWAKLSDREAIDALRQFVLGLAGLQTEKPELVSKAVDLAGIAVAKPAALSADAGAVR